MSVETTFYVLGGALVVLALVVSYIGVKGKSSFPTSRGAMVGGLAVVAVVVIGTASFAVALAREEKEHREHEQAEAELHAADEQNNEVEQEGSEAGASGNAQQATGVSEGGQPQGVPDPQVETYDVTSPEDGSLEFDPTEIGAAAGTITLAYANPSPVPHNINIEVEGETIAESETVTESDTEAKGELAPGEYIYYCSVPGHREGGMEGVLTVE
jgi:plastocyanin